ncbi:MAG: hypothetical protein WA970_21540, partial [Gammaproteobacteria bacterium]
SGLPVIYRDIDADAPQLGDLAPGTRVIIVRYLSARWAEALHARQRDLAGVVYFMDDDLLDPQAWLGLPRPYRKKLKRYCQALAPEIHRLASAYWVSTPALSQKYARWTVEVIPPWPIPEDGNLQSRNEWVQLFYHGTQAHCEEMRWLYPVVSDVLDSCPNVRFEIIGNHEVNKLYRSLPRTRILHPMSWPNYLTHCRSMNGHIGLALLLESPFNVGRSYCKALDFARCGAVGVYSQHGAYEKIIQHDVNGLLLSNDPSEWVAHLCELASQRQRLDELRAASASFRVAAP